MVVPLMFGRGGQHVSTPCSPAGIVKAPGEACVGCTLSGMVYIHRCQGAVWQCTCVSDGPAWRLQTKMLDDVAGDGIKGGDADL